eukprot:2353059-Amphidinium_carterae.1
MPCTCSSPLWRSPQAPKQKFLHWQGVRGHASTMVVALVPFSGVPHAADRPPPPPPPPTTASKSLASATMP